jgi:hypothetical protein
MTDVIAREEADAKKPSRKRRLCRKIDTMSLEISVAATTLKALALCGDIAPSDMSLCVEFLGKEIERRAYKIVNVLDEIRDGKGADA